MRDACILYPGELGMLYPGTCMHTVVVIVDIDIDN